MKTSRDFKLTLTMLLIAAGIALIALVAVAWILEGVLFIME
jgi:hypothetical protein